MTASQPEAERARARFRRTLVQVLVVQAVALAILGVIQLLYNV